MGSCLYNRDLICNNLCCASECKDNPNSKIKAFKDFMNKREMDFYQYENHYEKGYYNSIQDINREVKKLFGEE